MFKKALSLALLLALAAPVFAQTATPQPSKSDPAELRQDAVAFLRETMGGLEAQLADGRFLRVSRSAIVNLRRVKEIQTVAPGEHIAILTDGQRVAITRSLREVEERLRFA